METTHEKLNEFTVRTTNVEDFDISTLTNERDKLVYDRDKQIATITEAIHADYDPKIEVRNAKLSVFEKGI